MSTSSHYKRQQRTISRSPLNLNESATTLSSYRLMVYELALPSLALRKFQAITNAPLEVTIVFSSASGPVLNLRSASQPMGGAREGKGRLGRGELDVARHVG
jgi:hypothetical protein